MRANFVHPPFAHKLSDSGRCRGTLYADLSAWKEYVDYPLELTKGNGAVRAWLNLDQSRVRDFTAELQLPLAHAIDTKANGALQFMHNDVLLQKKRNSIDYQC